MFLKKIIGKQTYRSFSTGKPSSKDLYQKYCDVSKYTFVQAMDGIIDDLVEI